MKKTIEFNEEEIRRIVSCFLRKNGCDVSTYNDGHTVYPSGKLVAQADGSVTLQLEIKDSDPHVFNLDQLAAKIRDMY